MSQHIAFYKYNQNKQNAGEKKIKTILPKEVNVSLGPEEIYPGEEKGKNIAGRVHMKAQK